MVGNHGGVKKVVLPLILFYTLTLTSITSMNFQENGDENRPLEDTNYLRGVLGGGAQRIELTYTTDGLYVGDVNIGAPRKKKLPHQTMQVVFDTGFPSELWVFDKAAQNSVKRDHGQHGFFDIALSKSYEEYTRGPDSFSLQYRGHSYDGTKGIDRFQLGNAVLERAEFTRIEHLLRGREPQITTSYDGVLGLGLKSDNPSSPECPLLQLFHDGSFERQVVSFHFSTCETNGGEVLIGGVDDSKYLHPITRVSVLPSAVRNPWWLILMGFEYENMKVDNVKAVFDTGSRVNFGPPEYVQSFARRLGAYSSPLTDHLFSRPCSGITELGNFHFIINGRPHSFSPIEYFHSDPENPRLCHFFLQAQSGAPHYWRLGMPFFRKFYTIFDYKEKTVSVALAKRDEGSEEAAENKKKETSCKKYLPTSWCSWWWGSAAGCESALTPVISSRVA